MKKYKLYKNQLEAWNNGGVYYDEKERKYGLPESWEEHSDSELTFWLCKIIPKKQVIL